MGRRRMTPEEAAGIAGRKARELNLPWNPDNVVAKRFLRFWPLPGSFRVVSLERSGRASPRRVRHSRDFGKR
jgi:hypothetical protein